MTSDLKGLIGQEVAGFRITKLLGEGGMAVVFRGENVVNPKLVRALKIIRPELAGRKEFQARFSEEAMTLESLAHPNVVRFFGIRHVKASASSAADLDYDELAPTMAVDAEAARRSLAIPSALIMELELLDPGTDGGPLSSVVRKEAKPPALRDAVFWMQQAAAGVAAAHDNGIVHRDLKPENIFLHTTADKKLVVKVLDFGIAKAIDEADRRTKLTTQGTVPGTVAYMPPEVCNGGVPGKAADVYALGVSLYEVLLSYHPYAPPGTFKSSTQMMLAHVNEPLPDVRRLRPDVPPQLVEVLHKATAKNPADRYEDAGALAGALSALLPMLAGGNAPRELQTQFGVPTLSSPITPTTPMVTAQPQPTRSVLPWLVVGALALVAVTTVVVWGSQGGGEPEAPHEPDPVEAPPPTGTVAVTPQVTATPPPEPSNTWVSIAGATPTERRVYDSYYDEYRRVQGLPVLGVARDRTDQRGFSPRRGITAPEQPFAIQAHEVTWAELDPFLATLPEADRSSLVPLPWMPADARERAQLPATGVPWDIARRYCISVGGTLPTEEQWEWAARGPDLRPNPWGAGRIDLDRTNAFRGPSAHVGPVRTHDQDRTPEGLFDMAGNAIEWTVDLFREDAAGQDESWVQTAEASYRAVRGLPLTEAPPRTMPEASLAYRDPLCATGSCPPAAAEILAHVGFRCVR